ncbi:hypothetical protein LDENG_00233720 [Lucifuga dentata]|nr:hypothetical protein LDENG_00233720 [Lucifuga dentata]
MHHDPLPTESAPSCFIDKHPGCCIFHTDSTEADSITGGSVRRSSRRGSGSCSEHQQPVQAPKLLIRHLDPDWTRDSQKNHLRGNRIATRTPWGCVAASLRLTHWQSTGFV